MAKFYGAIGFAQTKEICPGVWKQVITERYYYGDLVRNTHKLQASEYLNDNINVSNEISIVSDPFADQNFHAIVYVKFMGTKWKITNVEILYPRLVLTVGGVYNGQ